MTRKEFIAAVKARVDLWAARDAEFQREGQISDHNWTCDEEDWWEGFEEFVRENGLLGP